MGDKRGKKAKMRIMNTAKTEITQTAAILKRKTNLKMLHIREILKYQGYKDNRYHNPIRMKETLSRATHKCWTGCYNPKWYEEVLDEEREELQYHWRKDKWGVPYVI